MSIKLTKHRKFLSYVFRHKPDSIGIELDDSGWVDIAALLKASDAAGKNISEDLLREIVITNDKSGTKIRAGQGHSVRDVDLALN